MATEERKCSTTISKRKYHDFANKLKEKFDESAVDEICQMFQTSMNYDPNMSTYPEPKEIWIKKCVERRRNKMLANPELHEKTKEEWRNQSREKYQNDPEYREKKLEYYRNYYHRRKAQKEAEAA